VARKAGQHIPKAQREDLRMKAWQMSKDGYSTVKIAQRMDLNRITVQALINEQYAENRELRKASGLADQDLEEYLAVMDDARARAVEIHNRTINRLQDEEELEALHAQIRDEDGKPPTTAITRALQFQMSGLPTALHAIDTMMMAMERKGKALGLEAAGKESAKLQLDSKRAELIQILNTPVSVEILMAPPPEPGWESGEDDDD
jgi:transposase